MFAQVKNFVKKTPLYAPLRKIRSIFQPNLYKLPRAKAHKILYRRAMGKPLDLENPKDFNEKIHYLMCFVHSQFESDCADKYKVRSYVEQRFFLGGGCYQNCMVFTTTPTR